MDLQDHADTRPKRPGDSTGGRSLCFGDSQLEVEFVNELAQVKRRGSLIIMGVANAFYVVEFMLQGAWRWFDEIHIATQVMTWCRIAAFIILCVNSVATYFKAIRLEAATLVHATVIAVSLYVGDAFRVTQIWGGDLIERQLADCNAASCFHDTSIVLALAGVTCVTVTLAAVRICRSWILVVVAVALYVLANSFGLSPLSSFEVIEVGALFAILLGILWSRSYFQEREFRRQWLDNRLLRSEVEAQKLLNEEQQRRPAQEQQRRLAEINERLEAYHCGVPGEADCGRESTMA